MGIQRRGGGPIPKIPLYEFWEKYVESERELFEKTGLLSCVHKIVEFLAQNGNGPSVTVINNECETEEKRLLGNFYESMRKVTLTEHSVRVTEKAVKMLKKETTEYRTLLPAMVLAGLSHDIGKSVALRGTAHYRRQKHVAISAAEIKKMLTAINSPWVKAVVTAIEWHHFEPPDEFFSTILREAENAARDEEIELIVKSVCVRPWEEWFTVERFVQFVLPRINEYRGGKYRDEALWDAFFHHRTVYLRTGFVYEVPLAMAAEQKITSMFLLNPARKLDIQVKVADALREKEWLAAPIGQGYFGRHYDITYRIDAIKPRHKVYLMPIRYEAFGVDVDMLQRRRTGYLSMIDSVKYTKIGGSSSGTQEPTYNTEE